MKHLLWADNGTWTLDAYSLIQCLANLPNEKACEVWSFKIEIVKFSPGISIRFVYKGSENIILLSSSSAYYQVCIETLV